METKRQATLRLIMQSDKASIYSLSLDGDALTEFEKILKECIRNGTIKIEGNSLTGTEDKLFEI